MLELTSIPGHGSPRYLVSDRAAPSEQVGAKPSTTAGALGQSAEICAKNIAPDQVEIWTFDVDVAEIDVGWCRDLLSAEERQRADRYVRQLDQRRFVVGRAALRVVLAAHTGESPEAITFELGDYGKPDLKRSAGLALNWAHAGSAWALALTRGHPVGIDIEKVVPFFSWPEPASVAFHQNERLFIAASPRESVARFFDIWTRKEALFKGTGKGIHDNMSDFSLVSDDGELTTKIVLSCRESWFVIPIPTPSHHALAVAVRDCPRAIHVHSIEELRLQHPSRIRVVSQVHRIPAEESR